MVILLDLLGVTSVAEEFMHTSLLLSVLARSSLPRAFCSATNSRRLPVLDPSHSQPKVLIALTELVLNVFFGCR